MGTFYSDEQIQEAIAALEGHTPGIFDRLKKSASISDPFNDEQEEELGAITRVLGIVLPKVSFVAEALDKNEARAPLSVDLGNAVRAAVAADRDNP